MSTNDDALLELYRSQPGARALFDSILERGVDEGRTTVDELTGDGDVGRRDAIALLRSLDEAGCGEFKVGRKGHPSRLEWTVAPAELAARVVERDAGQGLGPGQPAGLDDAPELDEAASGAASGAPEMVSTQPALDLGVGLVSEASANEAPPRQDREVRAPGSGAEWMIEHSHVLRRDLRVKVSLPADLTPREAEILADWIRDLSFERD
ncbi:hypothetical protein [Enhygromyxa salina]|nr:hypothetical protein [Enhygromyxa salina]